MDSSAFHKAVTAAERIFITAHVDPDPDALGTALGLWNALGAAGWSATPVCIGTVPSFAPSLPGFEALVQFPGRADEDPSARLLRPGDVLIVVDTPAAGRMEFFYEAHKDVLKSCQVIVFDHHLTNDQFGQLNFVDPLASSSAEVACDVLDDCGIPIGEKAATCFMLALLADTQTFRTENTSERSLLRGYRLARAGAPIFSLGQLLFSTRPLSALKIWGSALDRLRARDGVAWTVVSDEMLRSADGTMEDAEGLVDFILTASEVQVAIVLKESHPGETKVSMRTVSEVDATRIVGVFGGGGHARAAGCTILASPDEALDRLLAVAFDVLKEAVGLAPAEAAR